MEQIFFLLHILSLTFVGFTIFQADHMGFNWIQGKVPHIDEKKVHKYHIRTWIGLGLMITTGFTLFWPMHTYLLTRWEFYLKMAFIVTLICNAFVINTLMKTAVKHQFKELTTSQKLPLFISGAVSTGAWLGAFTTAFFISGY